MTRFSGHFTKSCAILAVLALAGCGQPASELQVEKLPEVHPALPAVPQLPPPPHPVQYPDQSYSVYGLRKRIRNTIDTDVNVTGYIVKVYEAPPCPEGRTCPTPAAPNLWIADTATETESRNMVRLVGYAENQAAIDEAVQAAQRGRPIVPEEGQLVIPTDFYVGAKIKVQGRFAYLSGVGFSDAGGLLEYRGYTLVERSPNAPAGRGH